MLADDGVVINEDRVLLSAITRACKLNYDKVCTRLPIKKSLLKLLIDAVPTLFKSEQPYLVIMYKALLITAYFGLFRVGELTKSEHVIKAADVHIGTNKKKLLFVLHTSKTHSRSVKPQSVKICSNQLAEHVVVNESQLYCPFKLISDYIAIRKQRKSKQEQFFVFSD